ncbi:MAG: ankyrin repeat domain-containing protein [Nanoarchaeota archaeon]
MYRTVKIQIGIALILLLVRFTAYSQDLNSEKDLLAKGADVNAKDYVGGETALIEAAWAGRTEIVEILLSKGADIEAASYGRTALYFAAMRGQTKTIEVLLAKGADVNAKDVGGNTPLLPAAMGGYTKAVEMLLAKGADVNVKGSHGVTALMAAAGRWDTEIVKMLLVKGADVNAKDDNGMTALGYTTSGIAHSVYGKSSEKQKSFTEIVILLKQAGVKQ